MTRDREHRQMITFQEIVADELNDSVREMLLSMGALERRLFIKTLEYEMSRAGLSMKAYLSLLGIAARSAEDLTPAEVGHLVRHFRVNAPVAMLAVVRVFGGFPVFATASELMSAWLLKSTAQEECY